MEMIYYTLAALVLYWTSDYILNTIEIKMGKRLPNRSLVFFVIITILALVSFSFIRAVVYQQHSAQPVTQKNSSPAPAQSVEKPDNKN